MVFYLSVGVKMPEHLRKIWEVGGGTGGFCGLCCWMCVFSHLPGGIGLLALCNSGIRKGVGEEARGISIAHLKC